MPNGRIEIRHNFSDETGIIIITWVKTSAPLAEVGRAVLNPPHSEDTLLITDIPAVMYLVRAYRSSDGISLDEEVLRLAVDGSTGAVYPITKKEYEVDGGGPNDPIDGSISLRDPDLENKVYFITEWGTGFMFDSDYTDRSDDGGGWDWNNGKVFYAGARYVVLIIERTTVEGGGGTEAGRVVIVDDPIDFDPLTDMGTEFIFLTAQTISFPDQNTIPDGTVILQTHPMDVGNGLYVTIQFDTGNTVIFLGRPRNKLFLGVGEQIELTFYSGNIYVKRYEGGYRVLGHRLLVDQIGLNQIEANGLTYSQQDVPRIMEYLDYLPAGYVVSNALWNSSEVVNVDGVSKTLFRYKSCWSRNDVAGTVTVPDMRGQFMRALSAADPDRVPNRAGIRETERIGGHTHGIAAKRNEGSTDITKVSVYDTNVTVADVVTKVNTGTENRPENTGLIPVICI